MLARREAIAAGQGASGSTTIVEGGTGAKAKSRVTRAMRGKGGQRKQVKESQERPALVARECLVNSSQEEDVESGSQSESSGTRRSTRRRKPVDKMGGFMIETIQGAEQTGKHPGEKENESYSTFIQKLVNSGRGMAISLKLKFVKTQVFVVL